MIHIVSSIIICLHRARYKIYGFRIWKFSMCRIICKNVFQSEWLSIQQGLTFRIDQQFIIHPLGCRIITSTFFQSFLLMCYLGFLRISVCFPAWNSKGCMIDVFYRSCSRSEIFDIGILGNLSFYIQCKPTLTIPVCDFITRINNFCWNCHTDCFLSCLIRFYLNCISSRIFLLFSIFKINSVSTIFNCFSICTF